MLLGLIEDPSSRADAGRAADAARRARVLPRAAGARVTTSEVDQDAALPRPGERRRRAGRGPPRTDDARGEGGAARQPLGLRARRCRRTARRRARRRPAPSRDRPGHAHLGREQPAAAAGGGARQRHPAPPRRADAARHPGDRPRGDLLRPDGARRDDLSAGDRPREHLGADARRGARRRDARRRCAPAACIKASGPSSTSAATRAGAASRRPSARIRISSGDGRRVRARPAGRRPPRRGRRHGEASRRLRRLRGRSELGASASRRARAARRLSPPVRGRGPRRRRALGDERLQRARRRPVRRRPDAADDDPPRQWGFEGCVVSDYFSIRQLADVPPVRRSMPRTQRRRRSTPGWTSSSRAPTATARRCSKRSRGGLARPRRSMSGPPRAADEVRARPLRAAVRRRRRRRRGERHRAHRELARKIARKSLVLLRNDGTLPLSQETRLGRGDRAVRRQRAQPLRRLRVPGPCRVDAGRAGERPERRLASRCSRRLEHRHAAMLEAPTVLDALRDALRRARALRAGLRGQRTSSRDGFDAAVALAAASDVAVMVMGDKSGLTEDCTCGESRDRASLDLPGVQEELVRAVAATGTPVVLVLVAGRPYGGAALHELLRGRPAGVASRPGGRRRDRRDAGRRREPRRQAADLLSPFVRSDPCLLRAQDLGRTLALEGRLRRRRRRAAVPVRLRPELHELRTRGSRRPARRGLVDRDDHGRRHGHEHRRPRRRRGRPALRPRPAARASRVPCSS